MAEAPQRPPDPLNPFPQRADAVQPTPPQSRRPRVGVVLAAGRSERLASVTGGGSKALLRLGGLSLVERAVRSLLAAGLERVLVVVGHDAGLVATVVGRLGRDRVRVVYADRWADGNGASLAGVQGEVAGELLFVLVTADHVFGEGGLERLLAVGAPAVLIDPAPARPAWSEGTRVRVVDQAVVAFGKHLEEPGIDCGAFLLPLEVFDRQRQAASEGDHSLAGAVTHLAQTRPLRAVALPAGCWWQDVDTPQDARAAKTALRRWARTPMGRSAACSTGPCRPGCRCCWPRYDRRPTWCRWSRSRSAWPGRRCWPPARAWPGPCWSTPARSPTGSMGRWPGSSSEAGREERCWTVLDRVGDAAILAGLGLWALDGHDARGVLGLTVAATTGALLSMASKDRAAALGLRPAPERALGWLLGGRDGRLLLVAVGAVLGAPVAALAAVAATSALSLGLRVAFLLRRPSAQDVGEWS
jgi:1L-myo-inositol 1-phosphate cytidylyltransferase / CDP-L-myo-inositol myo-inositolphosphotransferase